MSENNGEHTTNSTEPYGTVQPTAASQPAPAEPAGAPAEQAASPATPAAPAAPFYASRSESQPWAPPAQPPAAPAHPGQPPAAPRIQSPAPAQETTPEQESTPAPPQAAPTYASANPAANPTAQNPTAQNPTAQNPTDRIPAAAAYGAPTPSQGAPATGAQIPTPGAPAPYGTEAGTGPHNGAQHNPTGPNPTGPNPTGPIPAAFSSSPAAGQSQAAGPGQAGGHNTGVPGFGGGHAGPGYPASNAYPHAPVAAPRRKDGKKVGMGMFTTGILAAALVGGLVGGGTLFLLDGQGNNTVAGGSSQSAPLVVNNTNSVNQVTAAAAKAMPSVVTISATSGNSGGTGSGIILDTEGHILTNTHVVTLDGAAAHATIQVQTSENLVYDATIVGTDPLSDLAVIKISAPNLVPATLADSNKINVGDSVIAIGSPLGLNATVTEGIVSTLNRTIQVASSAVPETPSDTSPDQGDGGNGFQFSPPGGGQNQAAATGTVNLNVIQTDAAINPGNSGGALVNSEGQVIGVNVAIASTGGSSSSGSQSGNIGVGFSIPMDHAKRVAQDIIKTGKATHGQLGVTVGGTSSSDSGSAFSVGATVADVTAGSAAAKAGLQKGDVITRLGNRTISDPADLTAAVREQPGGATVKMDFTRGGKAQSIDITLDTMK